MTQPTIINQTDTLPNPGEIMQLLSISDSVEIRYNEVSDQYVRELTYNLPNLTVFNRVWDKTIFIFPSISNDKILEKKIEFYECAKAFRRDALKLMELMSVTFQIDLNTFEGLHELKFKKSKLQRGNLTPDWTYYLHGAECQFENVITGQIVEIIIITKPEFGYLDCYFFYNYMATTPEFKKLAEWFNNDYQHVCKGIELLALEGILTRVDNQFTHRNVIAL